MNAGFRGHFETLRRSHWLFLQHRKLASSSSRFSEREAPLIKNDENHWVQVGLALLVLVPIMAIELLNRGQLSLFALPFLLIGLFLGARRHWPQWSLWWLGWTMTILSLFLLFWLPGPARGPMSALVRRGE